ncbi:MAG TPA: aldo/keto reductase [Gaiellaceae bacterium]|nr:aldo/keto reductase [Gaiellaceae bacterium]
MEQPATPPTTSLGRTGFEISRLGLGAWAIGGGDWQGGWGPQDDDESIRVIRRAIERGINWIDTAAAYGLGHAEEVVGRALGELTADDRPLVFTKCGLVWEEGGTTVENVLSPASIRRECEDSLRRLGVEQIDLYQLHWPTWDGTPIEESWGTMAELVAEGKVRSIGLSNFESEELERCEAVHPVETLQPELNLLARQALAERIPWAQERGIGVIVYSPMASGLLTGRFSAERVAGLPEDDWRREAPPFQQPALDRNLALVEGLGEIAASLGCELTELVIAWTLRQPGVDGAIVGARSIEQLEGWIGAASVQLDDATLDRIAQAVEETGAGEGPLRGDPAQQGLLPR